MATDDGVKTVPGNHPGLPGSRFHKALPALLLDLDHSNRGGTKGTGRNEGDVANCHGGLGKLLGPLRGHHTQLCKELGMVSAEPGRGTEAIIETDCRVDGD